MSAKLKLVAANHKLTYTITPSTPKVPTNPEHNRRTCTQTNREELLCKYHSMFNLIPPPPLSTTASSSWSFSSFNLSISSCAYTRTEVTNSQNIAKIAKVATPYRTARIIAKTQKAAKSQNVTKIAIKVG